MALESKGFGAREKRTFYLEPKFKQMDYYFLGFSAVLWAAATYLKFAGFGSIPGLIKF